MALNGIVATAHFQLFAAHERADLRWRLLSGNNRELGRSSLFFPDAVTCLLAVKQMCVALDDLEAQVRRAEMNSWRWVLTAGVEVIVVGPHAFDRQIRCSQAVEQFRAHARLAQPRGSVMMTGARRWVNSSVERVPLRVSTTPRTPRRTPA